MDLALRTGVPADRHLRRRRRPHPGGRRGAHPVRGDLPAQRRGLGRDPADLAHPRPLGGRRRLLPRPDGLHRHGGRHVEHVHHRARRDQDGHRRGRGLRGARRRRHAQHEVRRGALPRRPTRRTPSTTSSALLSLPAVEQPHRPAALARRRAGARGDRRRPRARHARPGLATTSRTTCARWSRRVLDDGVLLEVQPLYAQNVVVGLRARRGPPGRHRREPAAVRWPARSTSTPRRRRRGSCARATRSTSRCSRSWTCPASCPAPTRSGTASSGAARS